jgi:hypothetical protein
VDSNTTTVASGKFEELTATAVSPSILSSSPSPPSSPRSNRSRSFHLTPVRMSLQVEKMCDIDLDLASSASSSSSMLSGSSTNNNTGDDEDAAVVTSISLYENYLAYCTAYEAKVLALDINWNSQVHTSTSTTSSNSSNTNNNSGNTNPLSILSTPEQQALSIGKVFSSLLFC